MRARPIPNVYENRTPSRIDRARDFFNALLEQALANSRAAVKAAQLIEDANKRHRTLELAARDVRYFSERVASAELRPEPTNFEVVAFGHRVAIVRDGDRRHAYANRRRGRG